MVGARRVHAVVTLNLGSELREHLRGTPCQAFVADVKLSVQAMDAFFYPDVMVNCHDEDMPFYFKGTIIRQAAPDSLIRQAQDKLAFGQAGISLNKTTGCRIKPGMTNF